MVLGSILGEMQLNIHGLVKMNLAGKNSQARIAKS